MDKAQKEKEIMSLAETYGESAAIFLTHYRGLTVSAITQLRTELREVDTQMKVVKNRLMLRALADNEAAPDLTEYLKGPIAIAFVKEDAVGAAKVLANFGKDLEAFEIRGGVLRGEVLSSKDVEALSKLPSKEELYAKLLGTLMGPASGLVRALQGVSTQLVRVLGAVRDTKQE